MRCARFCHPIQGSHIIFSLPEAYPRLLLVRPLCGLYLATGGEQTPRSTGLQSRKSRRRGTEVPRSEQNLHFALQAGRSICWVWSNQGVCSLLLDGFFQELYTGFIVVAFCNVQRGFVLPYFLLFCSEFK